MLICVLKIKAKLAIASPQIFVDCLAVAIPAKSDRRLISSEENMGMHLESFEHI